MKYYDVILIGAGISNIMTALMLKDTGKSVIMIEQGSDILHRNCLKSKSGKCVNCPTCNITHGFGGAGFYSDCKLTYSKEIGGHLIDYMSEQQFYNLQEFVDSILTGYGAKGKYSFDEEFANTLQYAANPYGIKLLKGKVRHLGTDGSLVVMSNIAKDMYSFDNIKILTNAIVNTVDFELKQLLYTHMGEVTEIKGGVIVIAPGRAGAKWLRDNCISNGVKLSNNAVDIGVRLECPRSITDNITDKLYEFKLIDYTNSVPVRTFCVNPGGYVVQENYDNIIAVNGHSNSTNEGLNTNFALLASCEFTEPFNDPVGYATNICKLTNQLADNKVMVQRFVDLKLNKRSTVKSMQRLSINPTMIDASPGDLRYALPSKILDSIINTIDNLSNVMPGLNGPNTILYGPEVKFVSSVPETDKNFESVNYPGIYFSGDGAGITRGIIQAAMCGVFIGNNIQ